MFFYFTCKYANGRGGHPFYVTQCIYPTLSRIATSRELDDCFIMRFVMQLEKSITAFANIYFDLISLQLVSCHVAGVKRLPVLHS